MDLRTWLLTYAFTSTGRAIDNHVFHRDPSKRDLLLEKTSFFIEPVKDSYRIYAYLNGQTQLHRCIVCGKELYPKTCNPSVYCSSSCGALSPLTRSKAKKTNLELYGGHPSSTEEVREKVRKTNQERYGYDTPAESTIIKEKILSTNMERYGVAYPTKTKLIKDKTRSTNMERYGVANCHSPEVLEKIKSTNMRLRGVEHQMQDPAVIAKIRSTNMERRGVDNPLKDPNVMGKVKATNMRLRGVEHALSSPEVRSKIEATALKNWGTTTPSKNPIIIQKIKDALNRGEKLLTIEQQSKLHDPAWMKRQYIDLKKSTVVIAHDLKVHQSTVIKYLRRHDIDIRYDQFTSSGEQLLLDEIKKIYSGKIITNSRTVIHPYEIDIYLPDANLAIEYNGIYWHVEGRGKDKYYHLKKTELCESRGIQLLQIFDNEPLDLWLSVIRSKLGMSIKIGARLCSFRPLTSTEAYNFLYTSHLQGVAYSSMNFGLFYLDDLVAMMSFIPSRYDKHYQWELLRYCCMKGVRVIGGASKLLKNSGLSSVISYANRRWSRGQLYEKLGMKFIGKTKPNYFYTKDFINTRSRNRFQKHLLKDRFEIYDADLTEYENMLNNGYDRIWDCGNLVYAKE